MPPASLVTTPIPPGSYSLQLASTLLQFSGPLTLSWHELTRHFYIPFTFLTFLGFSPLNPPGPWSLQDSSLAQPLNSLDPWSLQGSTLASSPIQSTSLVPLCGLLLHLSHSQILQLNQNKNTNQPVSNSSLQPQPSRSLSTSAASCLAAYADRSSSPTELRVRLSSLAPELGLSAPRLHLFQSPVSGPQK